MWDYSVETDLTYHFPSPPDLRTCHVWLIPLFDILLSTLLLFLPVSEICCSDHISYVETLCRSFFRLTFFWVSNPSPGEWGSDFPSPNPSRGPYSDPLEQAALRTLNSLAFNCVQT